MLVKKYVEHFLRSLRDAVLYTIFFFFFFFFSKISLNATIVTAFTISIRTPQDLTISVLKFEQVWFTTQCLKITRWVANIVGFDEMPHSVASHLGPHCLPRPVCPNIYGKFGITFKYMKLCGNNFTGQKTVSCTSNAQMVGVKGTYQDSPKFVSYSYIYPNMKIFCQGIQCTMAQLFKTNNAVSNVSLKLWSWNMVHMLIFLLKKM